MIADITANGFVAADIEALRGATRDESADVTLQILYEYWLKRSAWKARSEALPLVVGVDPERWKSYLDAGGGLVARERNLWASFSTSNGIGVDDELISVSSVYAWVKGNDIVMPNCFTRLYDFISQVTFRPEASQLVAEAVGDSESRESSPEAEIVLGAALSLVAKMSDRCRDRDGLIDGTIVAKLIMETAARWFPSVPPSMPLEQMAELIDRWLE